MNFRDSVKRICKQQGIMQKDLADKLGITYIGLSQTLRGKYPQLQTLERIAKALNVPVTDLFELPENDVFHCPHCGRKIRIGKE